MPENFLKINIDNKLEIYSLLIPQIENLLTKENKLVSNLSNLTALIYHSLPNLNWVGFYIADSNKLFLGPFQGKVACTYIDFGKGVCGTSAIKKETIIVPDVYKFEGHIFCDSDSKSEIVVPIIINNIVWGVLDIDSFVFNNFDELDKKFLEQIIEKLSHLIKENELFSNSSKVASSTI